MTKLDLIKQIAKEAKISQNAAKRAIEALTGQIQFALIYEKRFSLAHIGVLKVVKRKPRNIKPFGREALRLPARNAVTFTTSSELKEIVKTL